LKTQIADYLFLLNPVQRIIDNKLNVKLKIFYFTLEISKERKMLLAFAHILFVKEGIRIPLKDLNSTDASKPLSEETLAIIDKYQHYFEKIEEIVEFIDDIKNPTGIYTHVKDYALANGTQYRKTIEYKDKDGKVTKVVETDDYYVPNDPDEYVMVIIDHISLIHTEQGNGRHLSPQEAINKLSSSYLVPLRNKYNYIPVVIQQQASAQESVENMKHNKLKPSLDGLGDSKLTQRDADVIIGLFSPYRHAIPKFLGYDIVKFEDHIRFLEIIACRQGGAGIITPLYFDGAVNYFKELPLPENQEGINQVYKFIDKWKEE